MEEVISSASSHQDGYSGRDVLGAALHADDIRDWIIAIKELEAKNLDEQQAVDDKNRSLCARIEAIERMSELCRQLESDCIMLREQCSTAEATLKQVEDNSAASQAAHQEKMMEKLACMAAREADLADKLAHANSTTDEAVARKQEELRAAEAERTMRMEEQQCQSSLLEVLERRLAKTCTQVAEHKDAAAAIRDQCVHISKDCAGLSTQLAVADQEAHTLALECALQQESVENMKQEGKVLAMTAVDLRAALKDDIDCMQSDAVMEAEGKAVQSLTAAWQDAHHHTSPNELDTESRDLAACDEDRTNRLKQDILSTEHDELAARNGLRDLEAARDDLAVESTELELTLKHLESQLEKKMEAGGSDWSAKVDLLELEVKEIECESILLTLSLHEEELLAGLWIGKSAAGATEGAFVQGKSPLETALAH